MTQAHEQVAREIAEQVIRDVHKELPDAWLGGRQRYVLVEAIAQALQQIERDAYERGRMDVWKEVGWCREQGQHGEELKP